MAVLIKEEGMQLLDPPSEYHISASNRLDLGDNLDNIADNFDIVDRDVEGEEFEDEPEDAASVARKGPPADIELEKLPRPASGLNCRQARSYLVKLLRAANGGQNPQYGNPNSKPPFWPDFYWPWAKLTDVHTKPRGMEEPLLYSEMMKLAIQRGYKYYGYDPETYWDKTVEEKEPSPVERGTPAPILSRQVQNIGLPPKLPRPNSKLNCVQARTVLSKLLRYQQAGNNPVYGHPETRPPWWPDECIRWEDMVDLRGKPPYLPPDMTYTDVLKHAIDQGLKFFGYNCETWVDKAQYNREISHSILSKKPVFSSSESPESGPPRLPIPINKMNCGLARTTLSRLLRFHCGRNPKYGTVTSMPVWWPNDVFEWTALKNLSHRYDGQLGDSYSNCLRLAIVQGYEHYHKDPYSFTEETGEDLPTVAAIKRVKLTLNPQVSAMIQQFDDDIADDPDELDDMSGDEFDIEDELEPETVEITPPKKIIAGGENKRRPPPPLISIADIASFSEEEEDMEIEEEKHLVEDSSPLVEDSSPLEEEPGSAPSPRLHFHRTLAPVRKRKIPGSYPPALVARAAYIQPEDRRAVKRCRVDVGWLALDHVEGRLHREDVLKIARAECSRRLFQTLRSSVGAAPPCNFTDITLVFSDGRLRAHRLVLAASSSLLSDLLADPTVDCLVFPEVNVAQARTAVEALYTGSAEIDRRSGGSLAEVERCVRAFQEVGLLQQYTVQLVPRLPLGRTAPSSRPRRRWLSEEDQEQEQNQEDKQDQEKNQNQKQEQEKQQDQGQEQKKKQEQGQARNNWSVHEQEPDKKKGPRQEKEEEQEQEQEQEAQEAKVQCSKSKGNSSSPTRKSKVRNREAGKKANLEEEEVATKVHYGLRSPKKSPRPSDCPPSRGLRDSSPEAGSPASPSKSPGRDRPKKSRDDCKKPRFPELTEAAVKLRSSLGPREVVDWLMASGFLSSQPPACRNCGAEAKLQTEAVSDGSGDGVSWQCCSGGVGRAALREHSIFQYSRESLVWIARVILCWRENTSLTMCHQETGASIDAIFFWYEKCRQFFGQLEEEAE